MVDHDKKMHCKDKLRDIGHDLTNIVAVLEGKMWKLGGAYPALKEDETYHILQKKIQQLHEISKEIKNTYLGLDN
jgi:hypothetical protein